MDRGNTLFNRAVQNHSRILDTLLDNGARIKTHEDAWGIGGFLFDDMKNGRYQADNDANWPMRLSALQRLMAMLKPFVSDPMFQVWRDTIRVDLDHGIWRITPAAEAAWRELIGPE